MAAIFTLFRWRWAVGGFVNTLPGGIPELGVVGGRCEVGEAGELWDVVATIIYRMRAGPEIWQSDASWPCYLKFTI